VFDPDADDSYRIRITGEWSSPTLYEAALHGIAVIRKDAVSRFHLRRIK